MYIRFTSLKTSCFTINNFSKTNHVQNIHCDSEDIVKFYQTFLIVKNQWKKHKTPGYGNETNRGS